MAGAPWATFGRRGVEIEISALRARLGGQKRLLSVLSAMTVAEKPAHGRPKTFARKMVRAYETETGTLYIPRPKAATLLRALAGIRAGPTILPPAREIDPAKMTPGEPLYEYQSAVVDFLTGPGGKLDIDGNADIGGVAYLKQETGIGKSRMAAGIIARLGTPTLVVVPIDAIGNQWVEEIAACYPDLSVGFYHNPPKNSRKVPPGPATHDVVVIIVNTFRKKDPDFLEGFGLVVIDEAHEYHSPCNIRALWLAQTRWVLGLSATPRGAPHGLDRAVEHFLGKPIEPEEIPGFDVSDVKFTGEAHVIEYEGHPDHAVTAVSSAGAVSAGDTIKRIVEDPSRLRLVATRAAWLYHLHETASAAEKARLGLGPRPAAAVTPKLPLGEIRRHGVFVFAEHREYLPTLRRALLELFPPEAILAPELDDLGGAALAPPQPPLPPQPAQPAQPPQPARPTQKISLLRGGVAKTAVGDARRAKSHIVLTTYGYSRRGVSLPDMTAMILATPRRNGLQQISGRIIRRGSDESIVRILLDLTDVSTGLRGQVTERMKVYRFREWPIKRFRINWAEYANKEAPPPDHTAEEAAEEEMSAMTTDELLAMAMGES